MVRLVLLWKRGSVEAYGAVEEAVRAETGTYVTLAPTGLVVREKVETEEELVSYPEGAARIHKS